MTINFRSNESTRSNREIACCSDNLQFLSRESNCKVVCSVRCREDFHDGTVQKIVRTVNGEKVKFEFNTTDNQVLAAVLINDRNDIIIQNHNMPRELKLITKASALFKFLDQIAIRVGVLNSGERRIYVEGKLLGGDPLEEIFGTLKTHLNELSNPYLVNDILTKLLCISEELFDPEKGLFHHFDELVLPSDTKMILANFNDQIQKYFSGITEAKLMPHSIRSFKEMLKEIAKYKPKEDQLWEPLKIFLSLSQIKLLNNPEVCRIIEMVKAANDFNQLKFIVEQIFENRGVNKNSIDESLKALNEFGGKTIRNYRNLETLLKQMIKKKESKKKGIVAYWEKDGDFFIGKTIYLSDPKSTKIYNGVITQAEKVESSWRFDLGENNGIIITRTEDSFKPVVIELIKYSKFVQSLLNYVDESELCRLKFAKGTEQRGPIEPDLFRLEKRIQTSSIFRNKMELLLSSTTDKKYRLTIVSSGDNFMDPKEIGVEKYRNGSWHKIQIVNKFNWWDNYNVCKEVSHPIEGVMHDRANELILITDETDENKVKLAHLEEIKKQMLQIRVDLQKPENRDFLEQLINNYVLNRLSSIDLQLATKLCPHIIDSIRAVAFIYSEKLKVKNILVEDLLKQLVEEANYERLVEKEKSVLVLRTMQLLKGAYDQLSSITGKDLIFVMGNTGSGKSTTVNYLLGKELKEITNHVGDRVFVSTKIDEGDDKDNSSPIIGQSLGESETIYTCGYSFKKGDEINIGDDAPMIADCPGFRDTRGGDYEICTNLSIDEAVKGAANIRAIVLTIPVHSFVTDRGNLIIELIATLKERFPDVFDERTSEGSSNLFILITKSAQILPETSEAIRNGKRFEVLINESEKRIAELLDKKMQEIEIDDFELSSAKKRQAIWKFLRAMYIKGRVTLIDPTDQYEREELLQMYCKKNPSLPKNKYDPAMSSRFMRAKFGNNIASSTHTWTAENTGIFEKYLRILPASIENSETELKKKDQVLDEIESQRQKRAEQLIEAEKHAEKLTNLIHQLEKVKSNPRDISQLSSDLQEQIKQMTNDRLNLLEKQLSDLNTQLKNKNTQDNKLKDDIYKLKNSDQGFVKKINSLKKEITTLRTGTTPVNLLDISFKANDILKLRFYKNKKREEVFNDMRDVTNDDFDGEREINTSEYKGEILYTIKIEKQFKIVPTDPTKRKEFEDHGHSDDNTHIAEITGEGWTLDLGRKAHSSGKLIMYGFKTIWDGKKLPWIKITHIIPNAEFNEVAINNKTNEIAGLETQYVENGDRLRGKERELVDVQQTIINIEPMKSKIQKEIKQLEEALALTKMEQMVLEKKEALKQTQEDITRFSDLSDLEIKKFETKKEIEEEKERLEKSKKTKRNFAIIIKSQIELLKLLKILSLNIVSSLSVLNSQEDEENAFHDTIELKSNSEYRESTPFNSFNLSGSSNSSFISNAPIKALTDEGYIIRTCQTFLEEFNENYHLLKEEIQKDLNF